jgi:exodeoxyribonuclease VII large subunit
LNGQFKDITGVEKNIELLDPVNVLNRGYSITMADGKAVKTVAGVRRGTILTTVVADGNIISAIQSVNKTENNDQRA